MKNKDYTLLASVCFLLICSVIIAGCSSSDSQVSYTPQILPHAELHVSMGQIEEKWSLGLGCYWIAGGTVYNAGNAQANNAIATVNLIESNGAIRDSKTVSVGSLAPGASQAFDVTLDGECGQKYTVTYSVN